jgi:GR25 family glycosyltransferase involved in LPS biosynthesis
VIWSWHCANVIVTDCAARCFHHMTNASRRIHWPMYSLALRNLVGWMLLTVLLSVVNCNQRMFLSPIPRCLEVRKTRNRRRRQVRFMFLRTTPVTIVLSHLVECRHTTRPGNVARRRLADNTADIRKTTSLSELRFFTRFVASPG